MESWLTPTGIYSGRNKIKGEVALINCQQNSSPSIACAKAKLAALMKNSAAVL